MNKEILKYLKWLKENEYIWDYNVSHYEVTLSYGLSSVSDTTRVIQISKDMSLRLFLKEILKSADCVEEDIYNCLTDKNDYYGYKTKNELDERIKEEKNYLKFIVNNFLKSMK